MTMMFEVEDLAVASPATVSRCGMVYMEPGALGSEPLIRSWMQSIAENIRKRKTIMTQLQRLFDQYIEISLEFLRKNCKEIVISVNNNIVQSQHRILGNFPNIKFRLPILTLRRNRAEENPNRATGPTRANGRTLIPLLFHLVNHGDRRLRISC